MTPLKIGIIGLGVGIRHAEHFSSSESCSLEMVCDHYSDKLDKAHALFPGVSTTQNVDDVLDSPNIDLISVASYDGDHFEHVLRALKNGKHVFVEKPLCTSQEELHTLADTLNANPTLRLSSNLNLRTCPMFKNLRKAIQSGEMGSLINIEGDYLWGRSRIHRLVNGWRTAMDRYSIALGGGIHLIDLIIWMSGALPIKATGFTNNLGVIKDGVTLDDFVATLLQFDNGMVAKMTASGGCAHPHFHRISAYGTHKSFFHTLSGAQMVEFVNGPKPETPAGRYPEYKERGKCRTTNLDWAYPSIDQKGKIIHSFVDSILGSTKTEAIMEQDVFNTMAATLACDRAALKGGTSTVEYVSIARRK